MNWPKKNNSEQNISIIKIRVWAKIEEVHFKWLKTIIIITAKILKKIAKNNYCNSFNKNSNK